MFTAVLKSCLRLGLGAIPTRVYQRLFPRDVIGLCYHMVTDEYPPHVAHISPYKTSAQFEADLEYLRRNYEIISYEVLCERRAESDEQRARKNGTTRPPLRRSRPRPPIVLTFDDGLREHLSVVKPLLERYGIPAIFFITTDFLDNRRLFYRHKVSLCIEAARQRSDEELARIVNHFVHPSEASSIRYPTSSAQYPRDIFIRWIKRLTCFDEPTIDSVCDSLDVDCQRFLAEWRPYLTRDEVLSLAEAGFTIGAHGKSHARLSDLIGEERRAESQEQRATSKEQRAENSFPLSPLTSHLSPLRSEIVDSCSVVAELTGRESVPFAFPFSGDGVQRADLAAIRGNHPQVGMIFDRRGFRADAEFVVHRIIADKPPASPERGPSNLPSLIRREYIREARAVIAGSRRGDGVLHRPTRNSRPLSRDPHPASDT